MGDWRHPPHYTPAAKAFARAVREAEIAVFVERALPAVRKEARLHGYALAIHGSLARDLDLIAVPWTDAAAAADVLIPALCEAVKAQTGWGHLAAGGLPESKPHGRSAVTILGNSEIHIDLSIMPRKDAAT